MPGTLTTFAVVAILLPVVSAVPAGATPTAPAASGALQRAFADAAARYGVPERVLLGVSYLESRWDTHTGRPSVTAGYGPMHLTDARTALAEAPHHSDDGEDPRGDTARPLAPPDTGELPDLARLPASLRTVDRAARLTDRPAAELREDATANLEGGAALLAASQKAIGAPPSADPADWYGAVARYSGADDTATASVFADDVFQAIRDGRARLTDSGQQVNLPASPGLSPDTAQVRRLGLRAPHTGKAECPPDVACEWVPAPYEKTGGDPGDYGNHDLANRQKDQTVDYIVVHDTEGSWDTTLKLVQDPTYVSWHYTLRSSDGHIAQHVPTKDVAWHAGNWYVNAKSVGLEHEGFLTDPGTWYTEAMYLASARLVRYLAREYGVPLDRQHILGHDTVPGTVTANISGMHTDPGPYWDWAHYFQLIGAPFHATSGPSGGLVTVLPSYRGNQPLYTGCTTPGDTCPAHGSGAVRLYAEPRGDAPLVKDIGLHPPDGTNSTGVNDTGARASTGQQFAVAGRKGDWTAIWYLGQKAWFRNPAAAPTAVDARGWVVTPKPGLASVPVYGRAYPEPSAYPEGIPVQAVSPLPYELQKGQRYAVGLWTRGEYYRAVTFDAAEHTVVRGQQMYYQIQFGHRVAFVKADDVTLLSSAGTSPPAGA